MYPLATKSPQIGEKTYEFVLSQLGHLNTTMAGTEQTDRLHAIAGLSFDLLTGVQKWEKLYKMNQLAEKEIREYLSTIRLVGIMISVLKKYGYGNKEMMQSLVHRFQRYDQLSHSAAA